MTRDVGFGDGLVTKLNAARFTCKRESSCSWVLFEAVTLTKPVEGRACGFCLVSLAQPCLWALFTVQRRSFSEDDPSGGETAQGALTTAHSWLFSGQLFRTGSWPV